MTTPAGLVVLRGDPSAEELAAVVTVLLGRAAPAGRGPARDPSDWAKRSSLVRSALAPGPSAWRRSGQAS